MARAVASSADCPMPPAMIAGIRVIAAESFSDTIRSASREASLPPVIMRRLRSQITADISAPSHHPSIASSGQVVAEALVRVLVMKECSGSEMLQCNNGGRGGRCRDFKKMSFTADILLRFAS